MQLIPASGHPSPEYYCLCTGSTPHLWSLLGLPFVICPCWSTIGWPGGTEGLVGSVLRISPSTDSTGVSIAIEWDEFEFDHRALVSLERLGVQVLGNHWTAGGNCCAVNPSATDSQLVNLLCDGLARPTEVSSLIRGNLRRD